MLMTPIVWEQLTSYSRPDHRWRYDCRSDMRGQPVEPPTTDRAKNRKTSILCHDCPPPTFTPNNPPKQRPAASHTNRTDIRYPRLGRQWKVAPLIAYSSSFLPDIRAAPLTSSPRQSVPLLPDLTPHPVPAPHTFPLPFPLLPCPFSSSRYASVKSSCRRLLQGSSEL